MNLDRSEEYARARTGRAAVALYRDIEYELAMGEHTPEQYAEGERALIILRDRIPGIRDQADELTTAPGLSRSAAREAYGPDEPAPPRSHPAPTPVSARQQPRPPRTGQRAQQAGRRPHAGRRPSPRPLKAFRQGAAAVSPEPIREIGGLVWTFFLAGVGLSGLYLLLNRPGVIEDLSAAVLTVFVRATSPHFDVFPGAANEPGKPVSGRGSPSGAGSVRQGASGVQNAVMRAQLDVRDGMIPALTG